MNKAEVRSLSKNKEKVEDFLENFDRLPDIIGISETKPNSNNISNVNIPNYTFVRNDSPTCASGVGLFIKNNMQYRLRTDNVKNLWLECVKTYG